MNPLALTFAIQFLTQLPSLILAGQEVVGMINKSNEALKNMQAENRDPTDAEWKELNDSIAALGARLHSN